MHTIECIFITFFAQINHNSSPCSNSLLIAFLMLHITFIDFIWSGFTIDRHPIKCILFLFFAQINHNSLPCSNSLFGLLLFLPTTSINFI
jgi:hypothetical protein